LYALNQDNSDVMIVKEHEKKTATSVPIMVIITTLSIEI
jgi:hypothetical protein